MLYCFRQISTSVFQTCPNVANYVLTLRDPICVTVTMVTNSTLIAPAVKVKTTKNHSIFCSIYLQYSILRNPSHSKVIFVSNISLRQNQ